MPRSRVRGGRKQHNKRIKARYEKIKAEWKHQQELAWEKYKAWMEEKLKNSDIPNNPFVEAK